MLERIKSGDIWLWNFVKICMIVVIVIAAILSVMSIGYGVFLTILIAIGGAAVLCGSLYLNYFISGLFYLVACDKGYDSIVFSRVPFFLGMVGYILVCALPNRGTPSASSSETDYEE